MHGGTLPALITPGIEGMKRSQLVPPQYARWLVVGFAMLATLLFCPYGSEFTVVWAQAVPAQFEEEEEAEELDATLRELTAERKRLQKQRLSANDENR